MATPAQLTNDYLVWGPRSHAGPYHRHTLLMHVLIRVESGGSTIVHHGICSVTSVSTMNRQVINNRHKNHLVSENKAPFTLQANSKCCSNLILKLKCLRCCLLVLKPDCVASALQGRIWIGCHGNDISFGSDTVHQHGGVCSESMDVQTGSLIQTAWNRVFTNPDRTESDSELQYERGLTV